MPQTPRGKYAVVFVTVSSRREAEKVSRLVVGKKLAACVNIVPGVRSLYRWKGRIETSPEILLIMKTESSRMKRLIAAVRSAHSYSVPEIIALPVLSGHKDYLDWVSESLR
ncbi:MAG TPA: divalent-cation tolerance protein CutA [Elusimicrobiota bacterium]|nr:divalent-cation tolerance protein CutA [Elusimicrobiota bacterium]